MIDVSINFGKGDRAVTLSAEGDKEGSQLLLLMFQDRTTWQAVRHGETVVLRPVTPKGNQE